MREARERLQGIETQFPGASWLPVIFQNPAEIPPTWKQLCSPTALAKTIVSCSDRTPLGVKGRTYRRSLQASVLTTGLIVALRLLGILQPHELQAFDYLMRKRPYEKQDDRILVVQATSEDIKAQSENPQNSASLSEQTLTQLFEKLKQYEPVTIGVDIYRDFPVDPAYPALATYLGQEHLLVFAS